MTRDDPAAFAPPPAFGPFRVLHQIGIGALGPVFRTYEPARDRLVAVKVFRLDITPEQSQSLADELGRATTAGLFHPSVVEPIASGVEGTVAYRAEEYVAAESLDVAIRHYAPATPEKALPLLTQLAGAIDFARAAGVGHGALHLRDIFVTPDEARASGFGVVDALERLGLRAPVRRPYSAPERIAGDHWSTPADVFSLAAIAYELLTGRRPSGTGEEIGPLAGDHLLDHVASMRLVLARGMDDQPARRYPSALAFVSALDAASRGASVTDAVMTVGAMSGGGAAPVPAEAPLAALAAADLRRVETPVAKAREDQPFANEEFANDGNGANEDPRHDAAKHDGLDAYPTEDPEAIDANVPAEPDADAARFALSYEELRSRRDDKPERTLFDNEAGEDLSLSDASASTGPSALGDDEPLDHGHDLDRFDGSRPAAEDLRITPQPIGWTDAPAARGRAADGRGPGGYRPSQVLEQADVRPPDGEGPFEAEPRRTAVLPVALMVIIALLVGVGLGYLLFNGRDRGQQTTAAAPRPAAAPATATSGQAQAPASPKAWSEQAVGQQPPTTAPSIPGDAPPSASPGRSSSRAVRPAAPAAVRPPAAAPAATTGKVVVKSIPSGAGVSVNGRWRGRTPLTLDAVRFGAYNVRIVQPGFTPARQEFTLSAAQPSRDVSVRLERAAPAPKAQAGRAAPPLPVAKMEGSIYVDSRPRGARVLVDGRPMGTTPARIPDVPIGSHVVRLELEDHRAFTESTRVAAGQETRVTGSLERIR